MITRGEMGQRVLSELEEAGAENISCLLNTVIRPGGDPLELECLAQALKDLVSRGHVLMASDRPYDQPLEMLDPEKSVSLIKEIPQSLVFDQESGFWGPPVHGRIPEVLVTAEGLKAAREVLSQRGYEWWMSLPD